MAVKKTNDLSYSGKGISIVIKNDIKPCETPKSKPKRKRTYNKKNTSNNSDFLDKNNNQTVDSKIPIYRDLFNRNPNNIPQPAMVDWQAIRMGLLPAPPQQPQILPPPTQTPSMLQPNYNFNMPTQPDPYSGMARLMDAMRPLFLTNNPYNRDYENDNGGIIEDYVSQTNNEDILLQEEALREAENDMINETVNEEEAEDLPEEELQAKKLKLQYEKLIEKTSKFKAGRLKAGGTNSSSKLNKPLYLFSDEYMNAYINNLTNVKENINDDLEEKTQEMRNLNERINMETEAVNKEKLKTEKKILIKKQKQLQSKLKKIAELENYITEKTAEYQTLFPPA